MTTRDTIETMARLLRVNNVDLGDERLVLRALHAARFSSADVDQLAEAAIGEARMQLAEFGVPQ